MDINFIHTFYEREQVLKLREFVDKHMPYLVKIKGIRKFFQEAGVPAEAQKFRFTLELALNLSSVSENAVSGVYIVYLRIDKDVEHVMVVDKITRLILDKKEK